MSRPAVLLVVWVLACGCGAKSHRQPAADVPPDSERWRATDEAVVDALTKSVAASREHSGGVTHVVLLWLKKPGDAAAIDRIIETSREFRSIPGVLGVRAGRPLPSTRPVVDATFDVGLAMSFADEAALAAYEVHPQHVKAVQEVLRPLAARIQVYDIKEAQRAPARK